MIEVLISSWQTLLKHSIAGFYSELHTSMQSSISSFRPFCSSVCLIEEPLVSKSSIFYNVYHQQGQ